MNLDSIDLHEIIHRENHRNHYILALLDMVSNVEHYLQHIKEVIDDTLS